MASLDEDELTSDGEFGYSVGCFCTCYICGCDSFSAGFTDLLKAVEKLEDDFDNRREDIEFLKTFIASDDFKTLMKVRINALAIIVLLIESSYFTTGS